MGIRGPVSSRALGYRLTFSASVTVSQGPEGEASGRRLDHVRAVFFKMFVKICIFHSVDLASVYEVKQLLTPQDIVLLGQSTKYI